MRRTTYNRQISRWQVQAPSEGEMQAIYNEGAAEAQVPFEKENTSTGTAGLSCEGCLIHY